MEWSADEARRSLPLLSLDKTELKNSCPISITCPESIKYRPIDGSCHNRVRPDWGKADTPFARALPNAYNDGMCGRRDELCFAFDPFNLLLLTRRRHFPAEE